MTNINLIMILDFSNVIAPTGERKNRPVVGIIRNMFTYVHFVLQTTLGEAVQ